MMVNEGNGSASEEPRLPRARHIPGDDTRKPSEPYRSSPVFTAETLPEALQHEHRTKRDIWAIIRVLNGSLRYCTKNSNSAQILDDKTLGMIKPDEAHHLELLGPVSVQIDFYDHEPIGVL